MPKSSSSSTVVIDRVLLQAIKSDLTEALAAISKKHGIAIGVVGGSFTGTEGKLRLLVLPAAKFPVKPGENDDPIVTKARGEWSTWHKRFSLEKKWLGKTIIDKRSRFRIEGIQPNRKYPVLTTNLNTGKLVLLQAQEVVRIMQTQQQNAA